MKKRHMVASLVTGFLALFMSGSPMGGAAQGTSVTTAPYHTGTTLQEVIADPAFGEYGRLLFPADRSYYSGNTLGTLSLTWYGSMDVPMTLSITNTLRTRAQAGETIFYDIYTEAEKAADPAKCDTGLFFFRGEPGAKFAVVNAGGGFVFVGAMHDSFPHALTLSEHGYNAFALIYRPGAQTACEDLARAISFIFEHAEELQVDTTDYSLWGGSAGARMVANLCSYGTVAFGGDDLPRPAAIIMQYTGHTDYTPYDPPTYANIGENDGIASWQTMERRINTLSALGIDTEFHLYPNVGHGFGLGTGTSAEGWINDAIAFWEKQMNDKPMSTIAAQPLTASPIYFWEEGNMPAPRTYSISAGYSDPPDFRPNMVYMPVPDSVAVKGAVLVNAGGAFQFRTEGEATPVAQGLAALGYQCFVINYRLVPYTQEEAALDLARAVRYVRYHAEELGIDAADIATIGFSAGGILAGEQALDFKGLVNGTALDPNYIPDALDNLSADVGAVGMVYSGYGRLGIASTDVEKFRSSDLPPTYFLYGSNEVFRAQVEACMGALEQAQVPVTSRILDGMGHGFGYRGNWFEGFDAWLAPIFDHN